MCLSYFPIHITRTTIQQSFSCFDQPERVHFHLTENNNKNKRFGFKGGPFVVSPSGLLFVTFLRQHWSQLVFTGSPQNSQECEIR